MSNDQARAIEQGAAFKALVDELARVVDGLTKPDGSLNLNELIRRTGKDRGQWRDWFTGKTVPNLSTLDRPARALETTAEYLRSPWTGEAEEPSIEPALAAVMAELRKSRREYAALAARVEKLDEVVRVLVQRATADGAGLPALRSSAGSDR